AVASVVDVADLATRQERQWQATLPYCGRVFDHSRAFAPLTRCLAQPIQFTALGHERPPGPVLSQGAAASGRDVAVGEPRAAQPGRPVELPDPSEWCGARATPPARRTQRGRTKESRPDRAGPRG